MEYREACLPIFILPAGVLTVGYIHTENCRKSDNLEDSLGSLFSNIKKTQENSISIVVLLQDCPEAETTRFLDKMYTRYKYWIENKVLQIVRTPEYFTINTNEKSHYWEKLTSHSQAYIRKAKTLIRDIAFLWTFSSSQSDYFIQCTEDIKVEGDILSSLQTFHGNWTTSHWIWAENFNGLLTGRIYKTKNFNELVEFLDIFGSYIPVNLILRFYKDNFRTSKRPYKIPRPLPMRCNFQFNADNPEAMLTTSLILGGGVSPQDLYDYRKGYFWAWTPKKGDHILISFTAFVQIKTLLIETGTFLYEDVFPGGVVSVIFRNETKNTLQSCQMTGKFQALAKLGEPSVEITGNKISSASICCIKIEVDHVRSKLLNSWILLRTIAIFTR